jgi:hypothetical protein
MFRGRPGNGQVIFCAGFRTGWGRIRAAAPAAPGQVGLLAAEQINAMARMDAAHFRESHVGTVTGP